MVTCKIAFNDCIKPINLDKCYTAKASIKTNIKLHKIDKQKEI